MKYIGSKYQKEFMEDLKPVYGAVTKEAGEMALDKLEEKWGEQYPIVIKSWRDNWDRLSEFFQYSEAIRKLIYTTNTVEGNHRQIRKVTKNKGVFPNWGIITQQLAIDTVCCRFVIFALDNCSLNNERGNQILSHTRSCFIFCRRLYPRPCFAVIVDRVSNQGIFV